MIKSGFVNVIKPTGMSSSDVVCKVKKILGIKKVGHLGTLDPAASGVLPIAFGKATKFFDYFLKKDKVYIADVKFGIMTDTLDSFGKVIARVEKTVQSCEIEDVIPQFIGKIQQIPPKYSAIKVNGKKACDIARAGIELELKPREIEIYSIELLGQLGDNSFRFKVHCSAGTYIRTLFNDIAKKLNTVATTPVIIRVKSGSFEIDDAALLEEVYESSLISIEQLFKLLPRYELKEEALIKKVINGGKIKKSELNFVCDSNFFIMIDNQLIGMYRFEADRLICDVFLMEQ